MVKQIYGLGRILLFSAPSLLLAVTASPGVLHATREWVAANILSTPSVNARHELPFSFTYYGEESSQFIKRCKREITTRRLDSQRSEIILTYTHLDSGLSLRCVAVEYQDFPAVELVLYFKNT